MKEREGLKNRNDIEKMKEKINVRKNSIKRNTGKVKEK